MKGTIVPLYPGVNSAIGLLQADVKHDYAISRLLLLSTLAPKDAKVLFGELEKHARDELKDEGFADDQIRLEYALDMRYAGQGYEITIPLKDGVPAKGFDAVRRAFDDTHKQLFGHNAPDEPVEVVTYRVAGVGLLPEVRMPTFKPTGARLSDAHLGRRKARFDGAWVEADVYQRERLDVGHVIKGPAIVEQLDATLVLPPRQVAKVDQWKNIIVTEEA